MKLAEHRVVREIERSESLVLEGDCSEKIDKRADALLTTVVLVLWRPLRAGAVEITEDPKSFNEFASRIFIPSRTRVFGRIASEEEDSDNKGRPRIKMKIEKIQQWKLKDEVAAVTICYDTIVVKPCSICKSEDHRAAGYQWRICYFCQQPGHLFQQCPNRQQGPLSRRPAKGVAEKG